MTSAIISAFLTYTLITALTPGPNNILALNSVNQHGFGRSTRVLLGMSAGFLILMLICGVFTFTLISVLPRSPAGYAGLGRLIFYGLPGALRQALLRRQIPKPDRLVFGSVSGFSSQMLKLFFTGLRRYQRLYCRTLTISKWFWA